MAAKFFVQDSKEGVPTEVHDAESFKQALGLAAERSIVKHGREFEVLRCLKGHHGMLSCNVVASVRANGATAELAGKNKVLSGGRRRK